FASGLAATTAVLSTLKPGDEVAAAADLYGGTYRLLERVFKPWGLVARYTEDATPAGFVRIITPRTKLVWIETPTNPLLQIVDIAAIAELSRKAGALLAVDNTFASPSLQQPLRMERHCANARQLAPWLAQQPQVQRVYYPGLPNHPGHDVAKKQMKDFGGMVSVSLKGGKESALRLLTRTKLFSLAESLGGVES